MKHKIQKIIIMITIITFSIQIVQGMPDSEIERVTRQITPQLNEQKPVFENIVTTVYHSVKSTDFPQWTTGVSNEYDLTTSIGWCIIPQSRRGFYEDIKCQGSGVHEGRVYQYNTVELSPADSIPIDSRYTTGRTAKQTNPKPKWTVAVNNQPGTPCHIPYGTLMYIDFGAGNPWNGLYRAEDTGSAFRGECKMDVYAGVGLQESRNAEQHVSGKTPKIYVLEPSSPSPPSSLSHDKLAETYRFLTPEEYAARHGSATITSRYVPQLDSNLNQIGEITLPYSSLNVILGLRNFYDTIKEFSNEVLGECSNVPQEQKLACAYNKAKEYEDKIIINHCSEELPHTIHHNYLETNNSVNIAGIIRKNIEEEREGPNKLILEIEQIRGEILNIHMKMSIPALILLNSNINDFVIINNANITNKEDNYIEIEIEELKQISFPAENNKSWIIQENMKQIALTSSDCTSSNNNCLCEIKLIETNKKNTIIPRNHKFRRRKRNKNNGEV
jgi:3D (Asp-Asp-Asp) domain-containing protein